jgi:hypothetical protein
VPHCDTCDRFYNPNTLLPDGSCPTCGAKLGEPAAPAERQGAPWHFKLLIAITVVYLSWRFVQLIMLLVG